MELDRVFFEARVFRRSHIRFFYQLEKRLAAAAIHACGARKKPSVRPRGERMETRKILETPARTFAGTDRLM